MTDRDHHNDRFVCSAKKQELPSAQKTRLWAGAALLLLTLAGGLFFLRERRGLTGEGQLKPVALRTAAAMSQAMSQPSPQLANQDGHLSVRLSREDQQMIGVEATTVTHRTLTKEIDAVGKIDYDERKIAYVSSRIAGRLDKLYVNFTGMRVEKGQPLALIYSPDLAATQQEYLLAMETFERVKGSGIKEVVDSAASLVEAARNRLVLWGVTEDQLAQIQAEKRNHFQMPIYSPIGGTVIEKMTFEGKYVAEGEALYKVADLSTVWMQGEVYEYELPWIKPGQPVEIASPSYSGATFRGRVSFIDPMLNPQTRTVKVRVEIPNPDGTLKPQMFVTAKFQASPAGQALAVPKSAVLDTGVRQLVYLDRGNGLYQGRQVTLGPEARGYYPVIKGLVEGDRVVTAGNFLIDSQAQLSGPSMGMPSLGESQKMVAAEKSEARGEKPSKLKITLTSKPKSPVVGKNKFTITITDAEGKPVNDAKVLLTNSMPSMPGMPGGMSLEAEATRVGEGEYEALVQLVMAGPWKIVVVATRPGQPSTSATINLNAK
ncbi:MAG: efflux RND transporter periplasmic adaptor subunit [candidate division NC10 bacterium]|nr:efflux RND transporter periplasmic adaptor subunit [candidate division NC10 bacterium]